MNLILLERELARWHREKYGRLEIRQPATYAKLIEEVSELGKALANGDRENVSEECADILFVVCHLIREAGSTSLARASMDKLGVIFGRLEESGNESDSKS